MSPKTSLLARALLVASLAVAVPSAYAQQQADQQQQPCPWYRFGHCNNMQPPVEGLPPEAPREGTVITVDVSTNTAYLFRDGRMLAKSPAATASEKVLVHGDDEWQFHTPRGHMKVLHRIKDPVWRKPDWAFIEAGQRIPPPDSPKRYVHGHLGPYALDLGESILIHGTDDADSIGRYVSHGCIRLPNDMLAILWKNAKVGTDVYVFDSRPPMTAQQQQQRQAN